jgi:hypothetical protein
LKIYKAVIEYETMDPSGTKETKKKAVVPAPFSNYENSNFICML